MGRFVSGRGLAFHPARVAELVDAPGLGSGVLRGVGVRVSSRVLLFTQLLEGWQSGLLQRF